jgi:hypothetical protein
MSTALLAAFAGGIALVLVGMLIRTRARLARLEVRTAQLEARLDDEVTPALRDARGDAREARATARRAATAAGVDEAPRRLPLEPVTGPVVRAVAFGAGARRTLVRLATPRGRAGKAA